MRVIRFLSSLALRLPAILVAMRGLEYYGVTNTLGLAGCTLLLFLLYDLGQALK